VKKLTGIVLVAGLLAGLASCDSSSTFVRIASGPAGGSWYPLGAKISELISRDIDGVASSNGPGGGVGNVRDVNNGEAEIGWAYSHTSYDGYTGAAPFTKKLENIRHLATLYPAAYHAVVPKDSDIDSLADLKGKNVSPGKVTDSAYAAFQMVMEKYNITVDDIKNNGGTVHHVSFSDSVALMKDGHIDLTSALTSAPQSSYLDLEFRPGIKFIGVDQQVLDDIIKERPGYIEFDLTKEHYSSVVEPVRTLGAVTILVTNKDLPDELVYQITKSLWEGREELIKVKDIWNQVVLEDALLGAAIPVHPGAQRYYDEKGVVKK
jgi:TRAP transporter TAXI family solute receptor